MTTLVYNNARYLFATGAINWATANVKAALLNAGYAPQQTDQYLSAVPAGAIVARDQPVTALGVTAAGICYGTIGEFLALSSPLPVVGVLLYVSTGVDTTTPLVYYSSDGIGFPFTPAGLNWQVAYDIVNGGYFQA